MWYSQRDGWGHLYRYDLHTGDLLGQVTSGPWAVRQILRVDQAQRVVYFTASGLVEEDPCRRTVCRIGLDGSGFAKVTDDGLDHVVTLAPGADAAGAAPYFLDSASSVDTPTGGTRWWTPSTPARRSTGSPRASTPAGWAWTPSPWRRWASCSASCSPDCRRAWERGHGHGRLDAELGDLLGEAVVQGL
ncbi:DPP IV N-terminal domain-containing protein [Streptomyces sp. NPDC048257]|uniref:DPP IV N-terminal domain-containing protein n=1 Tax=Streptomyces sp. NPDC048257 TaxID=3365526 RepID=UPI00371797A3